MNNFERWYDQELTQRILPRYDRSLVFSKDNNAVTVGVHVTYNGEPAALAGTVSGTVVRSNGTTVPIIGTLSGGDVSAVLTSACADVPGNITVSLTVTSGTQQMTVLKVTYPVEPTDTDTIVDPSGEIALDVADLVNRIGTAIGSVPADYSAVLAAIAPNFDPATPYTAGTHVWYNGVLKRFTVDHSAGTWTGTDATTADVSEYMSFLRGIIDDVEAASVAGIEASDDGIRVSYGDGTSENVPVGATGLAFDQVYLDADGYLHFSQDGEDVIDPAYIGHGGGGGGGATYTITLTNTLPSRSITVASGTTVALGFTYSSVDSDGVGDGAGVGTIKVDNVVRGTVNVAQGSNTVDITNYLSAGSNRVTITVENSEGSTKSLAYTVSVIALSMSTTTDEIATYTGDVIFAYTVTGTGDKVVHFALDGVQIGTENVSTSGRARTYVIRAQEHGAYTLTAWATMTVGEITVTSNVLTLGMMWIDASSTEPLIMSTFDVTQSTEGESLYIPYMVYDPLYETAQVTLSVIDEDGETYSTQTVSNGRTVTGWSVQDYPAGDTTFRIACRTASVDFEVTVAEYQFPISVATDSLKLAFSAVGRSNSEETPSAWSYTNGDGDTYTATFSGFGWTNADGWLTDADNAPVLRFLPGDSMTIPFKPFASDARETGFTVEAELATRDVRDYESIVMSCLSGEINGVGGIGFRIQSQVATLRTQGIPGGISMLFKEDSHVRVTFVIEPRNANRLIYIYINGVMCGAIQYDTGDNIQQASPVGLTIGAQSCGIDLYRIRCYARGLSRNEQLDNYICDRPTLTDRRACYGENDILNESTQEIAVDKLPSTVPYMIIKSERMPTYKGDKLDADITFVDPVSSTNSFTANGSQIDVQGTSSAGYPVKNSKIKLKNLIVNGTAATKYVIHTGEHGVKTLCTKVDYASSEGANNVELVALYEAICREQGFLTPPQEDDSTVRQGISGRPIVIFWQNSATNEVSFYGKANMNWDKGNPDAFGFTADYPAAESWEFRNNTSNHCLFKSGNMSGWENDFEARYPDEFTDTTALGRVMAWVASTDTEAATGNALAESVTYDGVTYTSDTAAYRIAKFKAEFEDWFVKDLCLFYYIFTATFLMVDSRAKNMFLTTYDGETWLPLPYDFDTALGINNEGELVFEYNLEDTDTIGGSYVFNGQRSVLWNNVRTVFASDIRTMYQSLRTTSQYFNYAYVKGIFEAHQSVWPERLWNEDAFTKYLQPFLLDGTDNLDMLQGSKESQRDWWLYNAFRYWDSKYWTGDATTNVITLRTYASGDITLVPYSHIYARLRYGSYDVVQRATRNQTVTLACPFDPTESANDTETYLYSADRIAQIGDLSGLNVGYADFSAATKLQTLKLGDDDSEYENTHLSALTVGANELLTSLDICNCTALTTNVNLSGCTGIETVLATGSSISGVSLPNGGHLATLALPATVTNLTVLNQTALTTFSMEGYSYLQTLRVENTPNIPLETVINSATNLAYVRLVGVSWTATNESALQATIDKLETCHGQDASGRNTEKAVVIGRVSVSSISAALMTEIIDNFPDLVVVVNGVPQYVVTYLNYDNSVVYREVVPQGSDATDPVAAGSVSAPTRPTSADGTHGYTYSGWSSVPSNVQANVSVTAVYVNSWRVRYLNYDGTVLQSSMVTEGGTASYTGATPTKPSDTSYTYTFSAWSGTQTDITQATDLTATYTATERRYEVKFYNGTTLLETKYVAYGANATYTGSTPTYTGSNPEDWEFTGWNPSPNNVTDDISCYAQFRNTALTETITDSWPEIIAAVNNGTYSSKYSVGDTKIIDIGSIGSVCMQIAAFDADDKASGGKAAISWISQQVLNGSHRYNPELVTNWKFDPGASFKRCSDTTTNTDYNRWDAQNEHKENNTAKITITVTAVTDGTLRLGYITGMATGNSASLKVNGTEVVLTYNVSYKYYNMSITSGTTYVIEYEATRLNSSNDQVVCIKLCNSTRSDGSKSAVDELVTQDSVVISDCDIASVDSYTSGTGACGGWLASELRAWLRETVAPQIPAAISAAIVEVTKTQSSYLTDGSSVSQTTTDTVWVPSYSEVRTGLYDGLFQNTAANRKKTIVGSTVTRSWWLRDGMSISQSRTVSTTGTITYTNASNSQYVAFGFCM